MREAYRAVTIREVVVFDWVILVQSPLQSLLGRCVVPTLVEQPDEA